MNNLDLIVFTTIEQAPLIFARNEIGNNTVTPSLNEIIKFLSFYRQYTPLYRFNDYILFKSNISNLNDLGNYLSSIPELYVYSFPAIHCRIMSTLLSFLNNKITYIVHGIGYPRIFFNNKH